jgi:hypothetical protein
VLVEVAHCLLVVSVVWALLCDLPVACRVCAVEHTLHFFSLFKLCESVYHTCPVYGVCGTKGVGGYCVPSVDPMADMKIDARKHLHVALLSPHDTSEEGKSNTIPIYIPMRLLITICCRWGCLPNIWRDKTTGLIKGRNHELRGFLVFQPC